MARATDERLVLYSKMAFYPVHWLAFCELCARYRVTGTVIANAPDEIPSVHRQLGWVDSAAVRGVDLRLVPPGGRAAQGRWLRKQLGTIQPDAIWVQEEPTDYFLFEILRAFYFRRGPRIVAAVCENIFRKSSPPVQFVKEVLWGRLDGLLAVAEASIAGVRAAGMPHKVPARTLVAGALPPPAALEPMPLPYEGTLGDFVAGFAGRICAEKGWQVLLDALETLPPRFKCLMAGDGPEIPELETRIGSGKLQGRVFFRGLLPKAELWRLYRCLDCLVVPSLTFPRWKEQFGGVLADGMALGLPLIGSDSGAIPEVIGPAGLISPEGNAAELARALERLEKDPELRRRLGDAGTKRFEEFTVPAYARKIASMLGLLER